MQRSEFLGVRLTGEEKIWVEKLKEYLGFDTKTAVLIYALEHMAHEYNLTSKKAGGGERATLQGIISRISELQTQAKEQIKLLEGFKDYEKEVLEKVMGQLREVEEVVDSHQGKRDRLIQILLDIQKKEGWISRETIQWLSGRLQIPKTEIYHIATFYKAFSLVPRGRHEVAVCMGTACHVRKAPLLLERIQERLHVVPGESTSDNKFTLETVNCLGCCALGPVVKIDEDYYSNPADKDLENIFALYD